MSASVADELTFDRILDSLSIEDRRSVDRILASRGYNSSYSWESVRDAREEGYHRGLEAGRKEKPAAA